MIDRNIPDVEWSGDEGKGQVPTRTSKNFEDNFCIGAWIEEVPGEYGAKVIGRRREINTEYLVRATDGSKWSYGEAVDLVGQLNNTIGITFNAYGLSLDEVKVEGQNYRLVLTVRRP